MSWQGSLQPGMAQPERVSQILFSNLGLLEIDSMLSWFYSSLVPWSSLVIALGAL